VICGFISNKNDVDQLQNWCL